MAISWNVVNNTGEAFDLVSAKIRPKIEKIEKLLVHFSEGSVHLQVILDANVHAKSYSVALNLKIPSNVLHVAKKSRYLVRALDEAVQAMAHRLTKTKALYRGDRFRARGRPARPVAFAPEPLAEGMEPRSLIDLVADVLKTDYSRLLQFVSRRLADYTESGTLGRHAVDPRDVVDAVAQEVLRHPGLKPEGLDYHRWCATLAFHQTRRAVREHLVQNNRSVPVDLESLPLSELPTEGVEPEEAALDALEHEMQPEESTIADEIADPHSEQPDVAASKTDLLSAIRAVARDWPESDRQIFEMYYIEGFSEDEIGLTFRCERNVVDRRLAAIQGKLRDRFREMALGTTRDAVNHAERSAFAGRIDAILRGASPDAEPSRG